MTFQLFPRLTAELRLGIWTFSLEAEQVRYRYGCDKSENIYSLSLSQRYPTLFAFCRGSRDGTSRVFGGERVQLDKYVAVYFDTKKDLVGLRGCQDSFDIARDVIRWNAIDAAVLNHDRGVKSFEQIYMILSR
jgi:hypothetical protein